MKKEKSLCESCSNKVVIKFHGKDIRPIEQEPECFYNFKVWAEVNGNYCDYHVSNVIVDECSFYNRPMCLLQKRKKKIDTDTDSEDYGTDSKGNRMYGVTFTNIPGALLP